MLPPSLAVRAAQQGGVFTTRQALDAGYTEDEIQRRSRRGVWSRLRRGVYAEAEWLRQLDDLDLHRVRMAALSCKIDQRAVASHETSAVVQGLPLLQPDLADLHVTRADLGASRREAGVCHHAAALPADQVAVLAGLRHTTAARTAVDIARRTTFPKAVAACDSAERLGASRSQLQEVMELCAAWPGGRGASRAVAFADARAANPGESFSRVILFELGLPLPRLQVEIYDSRGLVGVVDFLVEEQHTIGEFDGKLKYRVPEGADAQVAGRVVYDEKLREDRLRALGFEVVRWTYADLFRPAVISERFAQAFARASGRAA